MIFNTLISLLAVLVAADASPLRPQQLDVVTPHITSPAEAVTWAPGSTQQVTWETKSIPPADVNNTGMILLGYRSTVYDSKGRPQPSENLDIAHPLAKRFPIGAGCQNITIPSNTVYRDNYILVLFGDSGNTSPEFKIRK